SDRDWSSDVCSSDLGHQPPAVDDADHVAVALDPELIRHRPPEPRRRPPVHMADVVVRLVLAHRLELGAEAERPAHTALEAESPEIGRASCRERAWSA